jgi:hypothetical protein
LKRAADRSAAVEDFRKLDEMVDRLNYGIGIFVNLHPGNPFIEQYSGMFAERRHRATSEESPT